MNFKTKARTLHNLKLNSAVIPKLFFFKVVNYKKNKSKYISIIQKKFNRNVAVRSSSGKEDSSKMSLAGYFESYLNVNVKSKEDLEQKINKVISSFRKKYSKKDEILIQEMVSNPIISGVATTADKDTGAPYYSINYSKSEDTSSVTSGKKGSKNFVFYKFSTKKIKDFFLKNIILLLKELEKKFKSNYLDVEFIFNKNNKTNLVQVRPLIVKKKSTNNNIYSKSLKKLKKKSFKITK